METVNARTHSFGYWLRRRRKALDLTQEELGQRVSCSRFAIRKIEADERRPSRHLAERLAERLGIPAEERAAFLEAARAVHSSDRLALPVVPVESPASAASPGAMAGASEEAAWSAGHDAVGLRYIPFVGRTDEFGHLVGLIAGLTSGSGHVALLEGESGIGKSRLIRELIRHAHSLGIHALAANCYEIEKGVPYQPVIELIGQALEQCSTSMIERLAPTALAELASLAPAVAERVANLPILSAQLPEARQVRLFRAIEQLFDALADSRQLIVVVDDIHWVDDASLQFLHYFARHVQRRGVLFLLAYRGEEVAADGRVATMVESVRREPNAHHLPLARLSSADTHALLAESADPALQAPGLGNWLHRESEGHPFFLVSILQSIIEQGRLAPGSAPAWAAEAGLFPTTAAPGLPEALRTVVRSRVARIPRQARQMLEVAAVLGRRFDFDTLQIVTKVPASALLDAVDILIERRLLREEEDGGLYDFSHDKIREAVYLDIGGTRRMLLHRAVAEALEPLAGTGADERAARLAEHYQRAQVWPKTITYLMRAAAHSQSLFAIRETLGLLDRAIALAEEHPAAAEQDVRLQLYEQRGAARAQAGQTQGAVADFERVIDAARKASDRKRERDLLIQLGMAYRRGDSYDRATACLTEALEASRAMHDERHVADTLYHLGTVAWSDCRNAEAIRHHQEAVEICERLGLTDLVAVQAFHGRGEAYFADSQPEPAIACYRRSIALAQNLGDKSYESENLMMIGWACIGHMGLGDYARAARNLEAGLAIARAADLEWHMGPLLIARDHVRGCIGQYAEAWDGLNETLRRLETLKLARYRIMAYDMLGYLLLDLDRCAKAVSVLQKGLHVASESKVTFWKPLLQANLAIARARLGQLDVQPELERALEFAHTNREGWLLTRCLEGLAEISYARGRADQCAAYADRLLEIAQAGKLREMMARAHRWRGEAMLAERAYRPAESELLLAAELGTGLGRPSLALEVQRALTRLYGAQHRSEDATRHQREADSIAASIASDLRGSELACA